MSSQENFVRALANLERSLADPVREPRDLSGILKDFEMTYELSWKVLKKRLRDDGHETLGAKDVFTKAFQLGYLLTESPWIAMISDRNQTAHVYDESDAKKIADRVRAEYLPAFVLLRERMKAIGE
jgi:nucleotidyltransferase substrate binding protein (TIGR01987 family)